MKYDELKAFQILAYLIGEKNDIECTLATPYVEQGLLYHGVLFKGETEDVLKAEKEVRMAIQKYPWDYITKSLRGGLCLFFIYDMDKKIEN